MMLADYDAYAACHRQTAEAYAEPNRWFRMAVINVANMGFFSSDRTIRGYAEEIWNVHPVTVKLED